MKYVLAFDPGISTGWAVLAYDGTIVACGNVIWGPNATTELRDLVDTLGHQFNLAEAIVERMPPGAPGPTSVALEAVREALHGALTLFQYRLVLPAQWKTHRAVVTAKPIKKWNGTTTTQHQRDAIGIARWWLAKLEDGAW